MLSKALSEAFKIELVTKMQEVVGNEIDVNDLFNLPSKPEGVQNNKNNNISVEYDYPSSEGNDQEEGIYEYIDEFSKPVLFFKKHFRKILAVLFLASLVVVSIIVFLIVLPVSHHPGTATTSKVSPDTTPTYTTATTKVQTTTESDDTSCIPTDYSKTTLYAYSNDLTPEAVLHSWKAFKDYNNDSRYKWYGSVRFDIENMDMKFHTSRDDVNKTILSDMPNRDQGFREYSIGSNVFDVIEKFFSNEQAPVCGAIICVLLKRYPNEADTSRLVSLIRYHHAILHVMTSTTPSGGFQSKTMYSVTSKTNGIGAFVMDANFRTAITWVPMYENNCPAYATNVQVTGSGTKTLPNLYSSMYQTYKIAITFLDHLPLGSFRSFNLRWTNTTHDGNYAFTSRDVTDADGTLRGGFWVWIHKGTYKMSLDYSYSGSDVQNIQIRLYGTVPLDNWLPYSD